MKKASARSIIFKAAALLILIVIAVVMFIIGRGHTVYIDKVAAQADMVAFTDFEQVFFNVRFGGNDMIV